MTSDRFYADLNPAFGAWQEKRYVIFDATTRRPVPREIAPQYASRKSAERIADRLNCMEEFRRIVR